METRVLTGLHTWDDGQDESMKHTEATMIDKVQLLKLSDNEKCITGGNHADKSISSPSNGIFRRGIRHVYGKKDRKRVVTANFLPGSSNTVAGTGNPSSHSRVGKKAPDGRQNRRRFFSPPPTSYQGESDDEVTYPLQKSDSEKHNLSELRQRQILAYKQEVQKESRALRNRERRCGQRTVIKTTKERSTDSDESMEPTNTPFSPRKSVVFASEVQVTTNIEDIAGSECDSGG